MSIFKDFKNISVNIGEFLQNVAEKTQHCAYIIQNNKFIFANNKFAKLLDLPLNEIGAADPEILFNSMIHPDFSAKAVYLYSTDPDRQVLETDIELKIINNSGREYWINLDIQVFREDSAILLFGMIIDITRRKRAEELLEISEERYRQIFENSKDAIFITKTDAGFDNINKAAEQLTGYTKSELLRMNVKDIYHPDNQHTHEDIWARTIAGEEVIKGAYIKRKDNSRVPVEISNKRIVILDTPFVHSVVRDITDRIRAEQALQESELFNRAVIERSPLGVSVRSKYGKLLNCNRAWQRIWNKSDQDIRDYMADERTAMGFDKKNDYLKKWHSEIRQIYELGGHLHIPEARTLYHDTGKETWGSQFFYAIKNSDGDVDKVVILTEDITERKKAEQALRASEEKFREIADMAPAGIYEINNKGNLTYANRQAFNIIGFTPQEINKEFNVFDIFRDDDLKRAKSNFNDLLAGKKMRPNEYLAKRSDGSIINLLLHSCPVYHENKVVGVRGVIIDITERKHIENALRNSEERYRTVLNAAPLYIFVINSKGIFTFIDGKQLVMDGLKSSDFVGKSIFELYDSPETEKLFNAALKGKLTHFQNTFNNKTYESRLERQFGADGEVVGLIGISTDITEIKKAKEALQETETKFRLLFENAGQPIFSISRDGIFLMLNEPAAVYLGGKPEEFIGKSMMDLFPLKIAEYQMEKVRQAIDSGQKIIDEDKTIINGQTIWYIISIQPIVDSDGRIDSALLIVNDITRRKQLENRNKAKSELLNDLRHTKKLTECLQSGCRAIYNAQLYNRSIIILVNNGGDILNYGETGFLKSKEKDILITLQSDNTLLKKISQNGLKISNSYFLPMANSIFKAKIKKSNIPEYAAPECNKLWEEGDQFFIPLMAEKNKPEGWLIVGSPFNGKWPAKDEAVFLEELADIIVKKVHEIQSLEILQEERLALQEKNITLREVLAHIEEEKMEIKYEVAREIENSLIPVMKKLIKKDGSINSTCYNILEHGLRALSSSAGTRHIFSKLSPREIEICSIIKTGVSSKELAKTLNISLATVQKHRESIRRKLGITNKNVNLMTYLKG